MALSFDGSDDSLTHSGAIFSGAADDYNFSLSAWVKPTNRHTGSIIGADAGTGNAGRFALFSTSGGRFSLRRTSGYIYSSDQYADDNTDWFHVLGTWQYGSRALYVNGVSVATQTSNISLDPTAGTTFSIGRDHSGKFWNGVIAEAAAYSVYLAAGDIASLAAGFSPALVRPDKLIGYWPLGGGYFPATVNPIGSTSLSVNSSPSAADHPRIIYPMLPPAVMVAAAGGQAARAMHHYRMLRCS